MYNIFVLFIFYYLHWLIFYHILIKLLNLFFLFSISIFDFYLFLFLFIFNTMFTNICTTDSYLFKLVNVSLYWKKKWKREKIQFIKSKR